jgi:hypothetical protein
MFTVLPSTAIPTRIPIGIIAPGKLADIVIWNSDPLANITVLGGRAKSRPSSRTVGSSIAGAGGFRQPAR